LKAGQCPDPQDHFTHVFIDETIQTTEPESVITYAGLINNSKGVVMAGDPKQLGPFIRSNEGVIHPIFLLTKLYSSLVSG
jgi:superfamily I DNA and/or RNA helicase